MNKPTVIIGASPSEERYSYKATVMLKKHGHTVYPVGLREGTIAGEKIITEKPSLPGIDTVTMYVGPQHQQAWYDYVLSLHPKRIIFNPGAENSELEDLAKSNGIETENACTLVLLSINAY